MILWLVGSCSEHIPGRHEHGKQLIENHDNYLSIRCAPSIDHILCNINTLLQRPAI